MSKYATRELGESTWPDFHRLFGKHGEWGACWCIYYQRDKPPPSEGMSVSQRAARNRRDKRALVMEGRAHGILVYDGDDPVGWCQYGPREEAPRVDAMRRYRSLAPDAGRRRLWRITCFSVDRRYRNRGVAKIALAAALDSIREKGGGVVEGFPVKRRGALATWFGTVSMFGRHGFEVVSPFGRSNVLMRAVV